jgi:hypothetical protein
MKEATGIIVASLLLALFLVWKEIRRPARAHLFLRLTASLLGVVALACLALPVNYSVTKAGNNSGTVVILTPGYNKDSLATYKDLPQYTTEASLVSAGATLLPDLRWFLTQHPLINQLHVLGYGLADDELAALTAMAIHVQYHAPSLPAGYTAAEWPRQLHQGEWLEVQGNYHNEGKEPIKIVLTGLGARLDSATITAATTQSFRLRCKPAHQGSTLYELETSSAGKTLLSRKIPVDILPASHLQVLLLSSSPDFDNKFLTTWLYENQYQVAARNTITKGKYSQQFLNREAIALSTLSTTLLEKFDVVIADDQALATLNASEKAALRSQIQKGLGLVLQTDSAASLAPFTAGLQVKKQPGSPVTARPLTMPAVFTTTTPLQPAQWFSIENNRQMQPLVMDDQGAVVTAAILSGAGKLVLNTVNNTYSWILAGNGQDYAQFWSLLLHKAARSDAQASRWEQVSAFPTTGSPVKLTLATTAAGIPAIETPAGRVSLSQKAWHPHSWTGTYWPVTSGWQTVRHQEDSLRLYIYDKDDWITVKAGASIINNTRYSAVSGPEKASNGTSQEKEKKQVPPIIFLLIFLACCSYLWFEAKKH